MILADFFEKLLQLRIEAFLIELGRKVVHAPDKPLPQIGVDLFGGEVLDVL